MTLEQALTQKYNVCALTCAEEACRTSDGKRTMHVAAIHLGIHGQLCATILITSATTKGWVIWGEYILCPRCWRRARRQIERQVSRCVPGSVEHLQQMLDAERASRARYTIVPIEKPN